MCEEDGDASPFLLSGNMPKSSNVKDLAASYGITGRVVASVNREPMTSAEQQQQQQQQHNSSWPKRFAPPANVAAADGRILQFGL